MIKLTATGSYNKDLGTMCGSAVGAIILEKTVAWWYSNGKKEFILFNMPIVHPKYVTNRSWKEISGLTLADLKFGLSFVGTKITEKSTRDSILMDKRPDFDTTGRLLNANHLILYSVKKGAPHYELNEELAERAIKAYCSGDWVNYIAPEPIEVEPAKGLTVEEAQEISSFGGFVLPPIKNEEDDG